MRPAALTVGSVREKGAKQAHCLCPQIGGEPLCCPAHPSVGWPGQPQTLPRRDKLPAGTQWCWSPGHTLSGRASRATAVGGVSTLNAQGAQSRGEGGFIEDVPFLLGPWLGTFLKSGAGREVLAPSLLKQPFKKSYRGVQHREPRARIAPVTARSIF